MRVDGGAGEKSIFIQETVNQAHFARTQYLVGQRSEVPERPQETRAAKEIRFQITGTNRGFQFQNPRPEFVNPHEKITGESVQAAPDSSLLRRRLLLHLPWCIWKTVWVSAANFSYCPSSREKGIQSLERLKATIGLRFWPSSEAWLYELGQLLNAVEGRGNPDGFTIGFFDAHDRGLAKGPSLGSQA